MLFYIIGLGRIICPKQAVLSQGELEGRRSISNPYVSLYGSYYYIPPVIKNHVEENQYINPKALESTT